MKSRSRSALLNKVLVYDETRQNIIGAGWVIYYSDGKLSEPTLYDTNNVKLAKGWYAMQLLDDSRLVVVPKGIQ